MLSRRSVVAVTAVSATLAACRSSPSPTGTGPAPSPVPSSTVPTPPVSPSADGSPTPTPSAAATPWPDGSANRPLLESTFTPVAEFHPVELVSPGFVLASQEAIGTTDTVATHSAALVAPFLGAEVEVLGGGGTAVVGLQSQDGSVAVLAAADPGSGEVSLRVSGRSAPLASARRELPAGGFVLGLAVCENQATVLVRRGSAQWEAVLTESVRGAGVPDLRLPGTLGTLGFAWGASEGSVRLGRARAGVFGMVGLRDPHLVQDADGRPWVQDGYAYLTWTCAGLGFFQQAHWGVFRLRLDDPTSLEQVAHVFVEREGLVLGDHAGQLVRDGAEWVVVNSSWGDFGSNGVHVRGARTAADLLTGVHVVPTDRVALPTTESAWDPALTRIGADWFLAFVESPSQTPFDFHPALATTSAPDPFSGLRLVGADRSLHQTEGTLLARDSDGWKLLTSDGDARRYPVYDLRMDEIGGLDAPYGSNIPHAQVIPLEDGGWLMITFDDTSLFYGTVGYGAHGSVLVLRSG